MEWLTKYTGLMIDKVARPKSKALNEIWPKSKTSVKKWPKQLRYGQNSGDMIKIKTSVKKWPKWPKYDQNQKHQSRNDGNS